MKQNNVVPFVFGAPPERNLEGVRRVVVAKNVSSKEELLQLYADALSFPDYFGFNWDAFDECLGDLSWLSEKTVQMVHEEVPRIPPRDLGTYLDALATAVLDSPHHGHRMVVVFPPDARDIVLSRVQMPIRSRWQ